jgi:D-alanyl-D-alanine carboxypeptidase/D-alanyl-D-alanine-endopeptidase (penicillin-binding protein 4)
MNRKIFFATLFVSGFATSIAFQASAAPPVRTTAQLSERLKKAADASGFKGGEVGMWVGSTGSQGLETYFEHNANQKMLPASLSKLVTMGAVLHALHPGYKFRTELFSESKSKIEDGVLSGSIYLKGGGDPSFVSENMWVLVNELSRTGITEITGDVIVDDTKFDAIRFGQDRQDERVDRAYDAPVGAMSMNWNSVNVYARPGAKAGEPLKVFAEIASPYLKVINKSHTTAAGKGKSVSVERTSEKGFAGDVIVVNGGLALDQPEAVIYKSISQPDLWAGDNFVEFMKQRGITVKGKVRTGPTPSNAKSLAFTEPHTLAQVVIDMAKWSNNYVAEMLVKNVAAESGERPATMATGMNIVRKYLESSGIKSGDYEFINAAGFTRKNRLSPMQLGNYLEFVRTDFTFFPEYLAALPIAGVDGTLRKRMVGTDAEGWVRAKTGLLNGAVGLAGFAGRPNGQTATFVFIYNGSGREDKARAFFDRMAALIVQE